MFLRSCLIILFLFSFSHAAHAEKANSFVAPLTKIPVLHDGRIKPMDSFARANLKALSGTDKQAMTWLTEALFDPAQAEQRHVLRIHSPALLNILKLEKRKSKKYSYREVHNALSNQQDIIISILKTPESEWTTEQKNLIQLQRNTVRLGDILSSLNLFLPLSITIPRNAPDFLSPFAEQSPITYAMLLPVQREVEEAVKKIIKNKGLDPENYTAQEQQVTLLSFALANLRSAGARSRILSVIPDPTSPQNYVSPWEIVSDGKSHPGTKDKFKLWQTLAQSYHQNDLETFKNTAKILRNAEHAQKSHIEPEILYNTIAPFKLSFVFYLISLAFLTKGALFWASKQKLMIRISILALSLGAAMHTLGVCARMYILERPPVSTLYESILFVGLVSVVYALLTFAKDRRILWLWLAAGCGALLHLLGFAHNQDGDSMLMLTAVLNTNFWLATHVTCITAGYAFCLITSVLAHYGLIQAVTVGEVTKPLFKTLWTTGLIALLLTAIGTVLGGIWADQSWGRFWGWDPKENGALLIVLWLIWIIHGKIAGQFTQIWAIAGLAYTSVIVALSWFGVNLLSVGLHAYGFTDSAAWTLGLFTGAETLIIGGLLWQISARRTKHEV